MASRASWLSDPTHRIQFVSTPKHTSWLNQIELWFSILVRRALKRGNVPSVEALPRTSVPAVTVVPSRKGVHASYRPCPLARTSCPNRCNESSVPAVQ